MPNKTIYTALKKKAEVVAGEIGMPSFYRKYKQEIEHSSQNIAQNPLISRCKNYLSGARLHPAHGIAHSEKVALEAGAILQIEAKRSNYRYAEPGEMLLSVQIAGLLHDITRCEKDHSITGSIEAGRILSDFPVKEHYKRYITAAIRNHEAFREVIDSENEDARLISDSLYDADKFRWGPDNFTTTLWLLLEAAEIPFEDLYRNFHEKVEGIKKIKTTFRTDTGRRYGPEFIAMGIAIGTEIYKEMERFMEGGTRYAADY